MLKKYSLSELGQFDSMLQAGDLRGFYEALSQEGFKYAEWAAGVAGGDTLAGASALEYLQGSALMGLGNDPSNTLTPGTIAKIKQDMAQGYLETLKDIARDSGGQLDRDVKFKEAEDFHEKAFEKNGLGIDSWTLKIPFDIIRETQGEQAAEERWERLRDTGGTGWDGFWESVRLSKEMGEYAFSPDPDISDRAKESRSAAPSVRSGKRSKTPAYLVST